MIFVHTLKSFKALICNDLMKKSIAINEIDCTFFRIHHGKSRRKTMYLRTNINSIYPTV